MDPVELRRQELHSAREGSLPQRGRASSTTWSTSSGCLDTGARSRPTRPASRRARRPSPAGGAGCGGLGPLLLRRVDPSAIGTRTTTIAFADDGMFELPGRHPVRTGGARDGLAQILTRAASIRSRRCASCRATATGTPPRWRHRRVALGRPMQGNFDQPRRRPGDRPLPAARRARRLEVAGDRPMVFEDGAYRIAGTDRAVGSWSWRAWRRGRGHVLSYWPRARVRGAQAAPLPNGSASRRGGGRSRDRDGKRWGSTPWSTISALLHQSDAGRGAGAWRGGAGDRAGGNRGGGLLGGGMQLLSGSFMDYAVPRADDVPFMAFATELVPSTANPIGMKGCGEAGTVGALAAVTNAALDAAGRRGCGTWTWRSRRERVWKWLAGGGVADQFDPQDRGPGRRHPVPSPPARTRRAAARPSHVHAVHGRSAAAGGGGGFGKVVVAHDRDVARHPEAAPPRLLQESSAWS